MPVSIKENRDPTPEVIPVRSLDAEIDSSPNLIDGAENAANKTHNNTNPSQVIRCRTKDNIQKRANALRPAISASRTASGERLQGLFVMMHCTSMLLFTALYFFLWCTPILWPFMIYYTLFHYILDKSPVDGGVFYKRSDGLRRLGCWKILVDYFPIRFHKMADLKPTFRMNDMSPSPEQIGPKYIFGYHPHGVIATGVASGFTNNGTGWDEIFPGVRCFVTTLVNQFHIPFYRDYLMALGVTTVVKKNLKLLLAKGASVVIVVGGARESLLAKPGLNSLVLQKRKGFIKLALECVDSHGICVVPVYGFGENDVYNIFFTDDHQKNGIDEKEGEFEFQRENSLINVKEIVFIVKKIVYKIQMLLKDNFGWTVPIVISRGIFNGDFGIVPYPKPINVVFGKPIQVTRLFGNNVDDPVMQEEIDFWHDKYIQGLEEVWNWGRPQFSHPGDSNLKIVE